MVFQSGQTKAPWPAQGKLPIDNGAPQHTWLQVISGQLTFASGVGSILNANITATSKILLVPAPGVTGTAWYVNSIIAGTGAGLSAAGSDSGTYNYTIIG